MSMQLRTADVVPEGDGVTVRRLMPVSGLMNFDPFVLWDHFDIESGGFPPHPHRGFEAITWIFDGGMRHKDDLGNEGTVHAGGAQCFTAGRGITHSEMPDGHAAGIQLWINLPQRLKRTDPVYQQVDCVQHGEEGGATVHYIVGDCGSIRLHTDVEFAQVDLRADGHLRHNIDRGWRGLIYVVDGEVEVGTESASAVKLSAGEAALIDKEEYAFMHSVAGARLMWCFGVPHHEPIHQHGPFVD